MASPRLVPRQLRAAAEWPSQGSLGRRDAVGGGALFETAASAGSAKSKTRQARFRRNCAPRRGLFSSSDALAARCGQGVQPPLAPAPPDHIFDGAPSHAGFEAGDVPPRRRRPGRCCSAPILNLRSYLAQNERRCRSSAGPGGQCSSQCRDEAHVGPGGTVGNRLSEVTTYAMTPQAVVQGFHRPLREREGRTARCRGHRDDARGAWRAAQDGAHTRASLGQNS